MDATGVVTVGILDRQYGFVKCGETGEGNELLTIGAV